MIKKSTKPLFVLAAALMAGSVAALLLPNTARADTIDPLHGFCNGTAPTGTCSDNGTNTPLGNSTQFGFTISPGPQTGDLSLVVLVPNSDSFAPTTVTELTPNASNTYSFSLSSGTWNSGTLAAFLNITAGASPSNGIGAFLPTTQFYDASATGFSVYEADVGVTTIDANGGSSPSFDTISGLPVGSYIVAFCAGSTAGGDCTQGGNNSLTEIATANSGALLVDGRTPPPEVPEPGTLGLFAAALMALGGIGYVRRRRRT